MAFCICTHVPGRNLLVEFGEWAGEEEREGEDWGVSGGLSDVDDGCSM